jgi:hypothetical protein
LVQDHARFRQWQKIIYARDKTMTLSKKKFLSYSLLLCCLYLSPQVLFAEDDSSQPSQLSQQPIAQFAPANSELSFILKNTGKKSSLTVTGPRDFVAQKFNKRGNPHINLADYGELDDGMYQYELVVETGKTIKLRPNRLDNGRGAAERDTIQETTVQSGFFHVKNGSIKTYDDIKED